MSSAWRWVHSTLPTRIASRISCSCPGGKNELEYWLSAQKMALSPAIYQDVRELIKTRLADTRKTLIADIDIG